MQNFKEAFGLNLHKMRKRNKLTIETFAEKLDLSARQVTRIESGENFPSAETICKICMVLNIDVKALFDIEWHDHIMYFSSGRIEKPNIKVVSIDKYSMVYYLSHLGKGKKKIREIVQRSELLPFLQCLSKELKQTIVVDIFEKKQRIKIIKVLPCGAVENIVTEEDVSKHRICSKNKDYEYVVSKIKTFESDKNKLEYIKLAIDALKSKSALKKIQSILTGIGLSK